MKFLVIKPGLYKKYTEENWTPLGVAYLAAYLEKQGIEVKIIDNAVERLTDTQLLQVVDNYSPDIVGFSAFTFEAPAAYRQAALIKKNWSNIKIVFGGVHPTFMPQEALDNAADFVVLGEGEQTTSELLPAIVNRRDPSGIKGIAYKHNEKLVINTPRELIKNVDVLPFPARHLLKMDKYTDKLRDGTKAISIMAGRGCPFECIFCDSPRLYKRVVRYHSLDYVLSEIKSCMETSHIRAFQFLDDTFSLSTKRVMDFCDRLIREGLDIKWSCLTRADVVNLNLLSRMKEAGCTNVAYGIESASEEILKNVKKHITLDQVRTAIKATKMVGIKTEGLFMIGNIGETRETFLKTFDFAQELDLDYFSFQLATPFPGTEFRQMANKHGTLLQKSWEHYLSDEVTFVPHGLSEKELLEMLHLTCWQSYWKKPYLLLPHLDKFLTYVFQEPVHVIKVVTKIFRLA